VADLWAAVGGRWIWWVLIGAFVVVSRFPY
jgi:hypothetical protein